jgi:hypothetical protein
VLPQSRRARVSFYNGTLGAVSFDPYHSIAGEYVVEQSLPDGSGFKTLQDIPNDVAASFE